MNRLLHSTAIASALATFAAFAQSPSLPTGSITRIAFGSCAKHWQAQPVWDAVRGANPDLWVFLGDAIYADTDAVTAWDVSEKQLRGEWNRLADKPAFQRFRSQVPMMATWDNHDYGSHAGGAEFAGKEFSQRIFLDFFGEPTASPRRERPGVYDAKIFGPEEERVQIILLDTKHNRSQFKKDPMPWEDRLKAGKVGGYLPDPDPARTHLGDEQWRWLEAELQKPAELRLVCSSTQVIPDEKGMDEWGNFPHERERLLQMLKQAGNAIILSGNVHFAEVSALEDGSLVEFTSSGMTHVNVSYAQAPNAYRVAGPCVDMNFGLLEIEWSVSPVVKCTAMGLNGVAEFRYEVSVE